jgi:hypothetical protein
LVAFLCLVSGVQKGLDVPEGEFVNLSQAAKLSGIRRGTLRDLTQRGVLPSYRSQVDQRLHLVRITDIQALKTPVPRTSEAPMA